MTINRLNYEVFLVDYLDGKLNPSLTAKLLLFLDQNPDIKNDLDGIQDAVLVSENTVFPNKSTLKKKSFLKDGIDNEFEYLCIASVEGVLTKLENESFEKILNTDQLKKDQFLAFQKSVIKPNAAITYSAKHDLKRTPIIPIRYSNLRLSISIAASIALIVGVYTIGSLMVSNAPLGNFAKSNLSESTSSPVKNTSIEATNNNATKYKEPVNITSERKIIPQTIADKQEKRPRINIEESIPNMVHRIDLKELPNENIQDQEELMQIAAKYGATNQVLIEKLIAQQEISSRESSAFEAIQYGVRSFGKIIGRNIKLDANKDKKGNIEKISFESSLVAFSTPIRKKE